MYSNDVTWRLKMKSGVQYTAHYKLDYYADSYLQGSYYMSYCKYNKVWDYLDKDEVVEIQIDDKELVTLTKHSKHTGVGVKLYKKYFLNSMGLEFGVDDEGFRVSLDVMGKMPSYHRKLLIVQ